MNIIALKPQKHWAQRIVLMIISKMPEQPILLQSPFHTFKGTLAKFYLSMTFD